MFGGKRNYKTAKKLRNKLKSQGITYDTVYTDKWDSFIAIFMPITILLAKKTQKVLRETTAGCGTESDGHLEKTAVSRRNFLIT
jgi:IS1 family transposase